MRHRKFELKALSVCLVAALSLMAVAAVSAQAATWLESGVTTTTTLKVIGVKDSEHWTLDSVAPVIGGTLEFLCNELVFQDGLLFADGTGLAELELKGDCLAFVKGVKQVACSPKEPVIEKIKIEQYLHEKEAYFLFSPDSATLTFTVLQFGPECAFGERVEIKGHLIVKDCTKEPLVDKTKHLIEQVQGTALDLEGHKNSLAFGKNAMTLLGSEWLELESKKTWAGHV